MVKKSVAQNLAPMGFYLTTIRVLLNGSMKKSLSKMQSLYALLFLLVFVFSKMLNDRNIENALSISNHYCSSETDKNILMKSVAQKRGQKFLNTLYVLYVVEEHNIHMYGTDTSRLHWSVPREAFIVFI
jgi:hypothetical protein